MPDFVIIALDLSNFCSLNKIKKFLKSLEVKKIYYVWGNMDGKAPEDKIEGFINLHLNQVKINDITLIGLGGDESSFRKNLSNFSKLVEKLTPLTLKKTVFITHIPPHKHGDLTNPYLGNKGKHVGSIEYLTLIKRFQPALAICGHIHEARGRYKINETLVYNVGKEGFEFDFNEMITSRDLSD